MSITISDPALLAQLSQVNGAVEVRDPSGRYLGTFASESAGKLPPGVKSPFTDEQVEAARREPDSGIPLNEFWKRVERGEWR